MEADPRRRPHQNSHVCAYSHQIRFSTMLVRFIAQNWMRSKRTYSGLVMRLFDLQSRAAALSGPWRPGRPTCHDACAQDSAYELVIYGGGGHGLATAHYLAKVHGITNVAVNREGVDRQRNPAPNTTISRSNYCCPAIIRLSRMSSEALGRAEHDLPTMPCEPARSCSTFFQQ